MNVTTNAVLGHHDNWQDDYINIYVKHNIRSCDLLLGYCKHIRPNIPIPLKSVAGSVPSLVCRENYNF